MVISLNFFELMNLLSCFQVPTKYEKKLNIWFVHLQVIFDQSPTSEKRDTWEFVLSLNSWNLNLKSKRVHLPRSWQKKACLSPPGGEMKNERGWAVFCHTESRKKSQRSQKAKRSSNQIKRVKENAWMLKLGEVC